MLHSCSPLQAVGLKNTEKPFNPIWNQFSPSLWISGSCAQDILILRAVWVLHGLRGNSQQILAKDCFAVWNRWCMSSQLRFSIPPFTLPVLRLLDQAHLCVDYYYACTSRKILEVGQVYPVFLLHLCNVIQSNLTTINEVFFLWLLGQLKICIEEVNIQR